MPAEAAQLEMADLNDWFGNFNGESIGHEEGRPTFLQRSSRRIAANIAKLPGYGVGGVRLDALRARITHCMPGLEPVIHATAHNILDQGEGPRANHLVVEADVQVFGLHRPIR